MDHHRKTQVRFFYLLSYCLSFSSVHPSIHPSVHRLLTLLYCPLLDTPSAKLTGLGSFNQCIRQLWRPLQNKTFKKPLLWTWEQIYFFCRYVAALGSSALYELCWIFHCQIYHIQSNIYVPKLNPECSVSSCSAASAMKQLRVAFQKRCFSHDVS